VTRLRRILAAAAIPLLLPAALAGCAGTVSLQPAQNADDPRCAAVSVRLPDTVAGQDRRWTDAQATAAWGSPASVILSCGVPEPGPSTLRCETVEDVDWLIDESRGDEDLYTFTTFGRSPAAEVFLDFGVVGSADTLRTLSPILDRQLEKTGAVCTPRP
jgi:hypothetical protein